MEHKLIDNQKYDLKALEEKQPLDLRPFLEGPSPVDETSDHELGHDCSLKTDPYLLNDNGNACLKLLVVFVSEGWCACAVIYYRVAHFA